MPNLKRITPAVALAIALVVTMAGLAFAGPNSGAKIAAALDKASGVKAGDTVTLTVSATVLSGLTGFSVDVLYDSNAVGNPAATVKLQGGVPLPASIGTTTVSGYNRKATAGSAILGGSLAATSSDLVAFAFVTKTGFTTTNLALSQAILIAGAQRDTIALSPSPMVVQINPPAPQAALTPKTSTVDFNRRPQVLTATYTKAAGDTISWSARISSSSGAIRVNISAIDTPAVGTLPTLPALLGTTATTFRTRTRGAGGTSTITLAWRDGIGKATATVAVSAGGTVDTATVIFDVPFPAELSAFAGTFVDGQVQLNWTAVSQTNNAGWRVLRSTDSEHFEPVSGIVPGAGTSNERLDYRYADVNLPKDVDKLYYVLEQVDLDGKVTRSRVAEVLLGGRFADTPKEFSTAVYPNPFNPATTIAYSLPEAAKVSIVIYDAIGQEVRTLVGSAETAAGRYTVQWDAKDSSGRNVASGVYFAHITAGKFKDIRKMMLLK